MAKERYLYSPIYSFTAESIIAQLDELMGEDVTLRVNSPGGQVAAGWGICAKVKEHGNVTVKVDGVAASMAADIIMYAERVECLDISRFMIHRADMMTSTDAEKQLLADINADLKAKLSQKIDGDKLKKLKGVSIDDIFDPEQRVDVWLSAKEAKQIGLVDKINKLDAKEVTKEIEMFSNYFSAAAIAEESGTPTPQPKPSLKTSHMNLEKLKADHPELYKEIFDLGTAAERDRVGAWMAFNDIDPEAVRKGIEEGKALAAKQMAEFTRKGMSAEALKKIEAEATAAVTTGEPESKVKTEQEKKKADFEKSVRAELKLPVTA